MALRMLLSPKLKQERRHVPEDGPDSMNFGVAPRTERDHQVKDRPTRHPMMNDDRSLVPARGVTDTATIAVALQHRFPQSSELVLILLFQRLTGAHRVQGKHLCVPTRQCITR